MKILKEKQKVVHFEIKMSQIRKKRQGKESPPS